MSDDIGKLADEVIGRMKTTEELKTVPFEMYARVLDRAVKAEAERDALRKNFAKYLVPAYRAFPPETARTCDEELDQSGALLGYVRDAARAARDHSQGGEG